MYAYEKLGAFYLGKRVDSDSQELVDELYLYDSKDLTTHGLVVGMTGSGKTGLSLSILEEAAIDGIPAIAIDPKGDIANLFLSFPNLDADSFAPWIDPAEAARNGLNVAEMAEKTAKLWRTGLKEWGQDGARIARFRQSCDLALYTPGSLSGRPLRVLQSFAAPSAAVMADGDALRDAINGVTAGLLSLLDIDADPIASREFVLIATILEHSWQQGEDVSLVRLVGLIQSPPFARVGLLDLETFFPSKDRMALVLRMNNLFASPGFSAWMEGEPLDIQRLLYREDGTPKISIISIAHLPDQQRMFFVSLLLNAMVSWVRSQPGTGSLRALLYMDEIAGFFPPVANPPSKPPMLTLLKQARAHGLGVLLATQNPVDLDYKGLSNIGTWFLGRLQTEQDKSRVLDGLEGASIGAFDREAIDRLLSGLGSRVFMVNNVHEDAPMLFHTRWALSYLRGPLTRDHIRQLSQSNAPLLPQPQEAEPTTTARVLLPAGVEERFVPFIAPKGNGRILYRPALAVRVRLHYILAKAGVDQWREGLYVAPLQADTDGDAAWEYGSLANIETLDEEPLSNTEFATLPDFVGVTKTWRGLKTRLKQTLYAKEQQFIYHASALKIYSEPPQSLGDFRASLTHSFREYRDRQLEQLKQKYMPKIERLNARISTQEDRLEREQDEHRSRKMNAVVSIGASILGALFGRKITSSRNVGRASSAIRKTTGISKSSGDVERAEERLEDLKQDMVALDEAFEEERATLEDQLTLDQVDINEQLVRPRKGDIEIGKIWVLWQPWIVDQDGVARPL
jgi:hypothetical protein